MDDLTREGDVITIHKPFNKQVQLRLIDDNPIMENETEAVSLDDKSISEVFWLTKVLGDYSINKVGNQFVFDNGDQKLILQRID